MIVFFTILLCASGVCQLCGSEDLLPGPVLITILVSAQVRGSSGVCGFEGHLPCAVHRDTQANSSHRHGDRVK